MILGVFETTAPYEQEAVQLRSGDLLVLFTDGVSEAMNREGKDYGEERLVRVIRSMKPRDAEEVLKSIHHDVVAHAGEAPQSDDITMMVIALE
jgi:sigma-B regulation protein RsbU (phosphoserine phosphatase)